MANPDDYIVRYTDPVREDGTLGDSTFIVRPFTVDGPAHPTLDVLYNDPDTGSATNKRAPVVLFGKGITEYGETFANNLLQLTENFAGATPPETVDGVPGAAWYQDQRYWVDVNALGALNTVYIYRNNTNDWVNLSTLNTVTSGPFASRPVSPTSGDYYYSTNTEELFLYYEWPNSNITGWLLRSARIEENTAPVTGTDFPRRFLSVYDPNIEAFNKLVPFTGNDAGDPITGDLYVAGKIELTNPPATPGSSDLVTKDYVDTEIALAIGGVNDLDALLDVTLTAPVSDEILRYNGAQWVNDDLTNVGTFSTGVDARIALASIGDLSDVDITGVASGEVLEWNGTQFVPVTASLTDTFVASGTLDAPSGDLTLVYNDATDITVSDIASKANLDAHIADTLDAHDASAISVSPAVLGQTNVQTTLETIESIVVAGTGYQSFSDGTTTTLSGNGETPTQTFRLRSGNAALDIVVTDNDAGFGDNALFTIDQSNIDHNALANFVANEHIDHSAVSIVAGDGLAGGGNITTSVNLAVDSTVARLNQTETVTGTWTFNNNITVPLTPTSPGHAASRDYVDSVAQGLVTRGAVNAATTGNLTAVYNNGTSGVGATLTGTGALPTIDGVTLSNGDSVLVKDQTNAFENGRYIATQVTANWILTRCGACDEADEIPGSFTFVAAGTTQANTGWVQTVANPSTFTVGTDDVDVIQFSGAGSYAAGDGLTLTGTTFDVGAGTGIIVNANDIEVDPTGVNHDALLNFVANEHVDHSAVSILAGTGLTGGGTITTNRTLNLANTAVTPGSYTNANITVDAQGRLTAAANGSGGGTGGPLGEIAYSDGVNGLDSNSNLFWNDAQQRLEVQSRIDVRNATPATVLTFQGLTGAPPVGRIYTSNADLQLIGGGPQVVRNRVEVLTSVNFVGGSRVGVIVAGAEGFSTTPDGRGVQILGGTADTATNSDGGDVLLTAGSGDGTGADGVIRLTEGFVRVEDQQGSTFTSPGVLALKQTGNTPTITFHANGGSRFGEIQGTSGGIEITPDVGNITLDGLNWPTADGTNGQVLTTDGSGNLSFTTVASGSASWGSITGTLSAQTDLQTALNAKADETVDIIAGAGLTGGGNLTTNRTLNVGAGTGITVNANDIAVNPAGVNHDALLNFVANEHVDHSAVSINAGTGLTGGGNITTSRTINLANTAVSPGSYTNANITVDAQGRITAASNGSGGGIAAVVDDTTPELGGLLQTNGNEIHSNASLVFDVNATAQFETGSSFNVIATGDLNFSGTDFNWNGNNVFAPNRSAYTQDVLYGWDDSAGQDVGFTAGLGLTTSGTALNVQATDSIAVGTGSVRLVGDTASPGGSHFYGTNGAGTRGWYSLSTLTPTTFVDALTTSFSNSTSTFLSTPLAITGLSSGSWYAFEGFLRTSKIGAGTCDLRILLSSSTSDVYFTGWHEDPSNAASRTDFSIRTPNSTTSGILALAPSSGNERVVWFTGYVFDTTQVQFQLRNTSGTGSGISAGSWIRLTQVT